jgi:hypothetical protein
MLNMEQYTQANKQGEKFDVIRNINGKLYQVIDLLVCYRVIEIYGNKTIAEFPYANSTKKTKALRDATAIIDNKDYSLAA